MHVTGRAGCAIVALRAGESASEIRALRGVQRAISAAFVRVQAARARSVLARSGYGRTYSLQWDRGTAVRLSGVRRERVRVIAHHFPLNALVVGLRRPQETAFEAAVRELDRENATPFRADSLLFAASGVIVAPGDGAVLRVGVGPAAARITEQLESLELLESRRPPPLITERVPWPIAGGAVGLAVWSGERRLPGRRPSPQLAPALVSDCVEFLVGLHRVSQEGPARLIADDAEVVAAFATPTSAKRVRDLGRDLDDRLAPITRGFGHGDFWTGNLLADGGRLRGVVDWPSAGPGVLPLLDLFHLKANASRELTGRDLGTVLVDDLLHEVRAGGSHVVRDYCKRIELDARSETLVDLLKAYWLQAVAHDFLDPDRDPHQSARAKWREVNIEQVVEAFCARSRATPRPTSSALQPEPARAGRPSGERAGVILTTAADLAEVEDAWAALAESRGNPFVSPAWFWAWLRTCGLEDRAFVPTLRASDGRLVGLLPLVVSGNRLRSLAFAGAAFADYFHPVAAAGADEVATGRAAAAALRERRREWAIFVADYVEEQAPWLTELAATKTMPLASARYHDRPSVYRSATLAGLTWDGYLATRSANFRSQLGRKARGLERHREVVYRAADEETLTPDMETLFDLHARRWAGRHTTVFATEGARRFHLEFASAALTLGWLRLWVLEVDGTPIAAWYGWRVGNRFLYYQAGFDPEWSSHSPGLLMLGHTMRAALDEGADVYDMLLGDETYKARFADADERAATTIVLTRRTHPARALVAADIAARRAVRRLSLGRSTPVRAALAPVLRRWPVVTAP
jgi:CelD/BcsL family acetyltransferase involved in cellulose biosynthesis